MSPEKAGKKEGKKAREETSSPGSEGKNNALLRQMAADMAAVSANLGRLQSDVDTLKGLSDHLSPSEARPAKKSGKERQTADASGVLETLQAALDKEPEVVVALAVPAVRSGGEQNAAYLSLPNQEALSRIDTAQVARIGYAFSSVPKVALVRLLLDSGELTAAQLGEGAGLTTGSLYHHLRELVHAEVACQSSRSHYALTDLGRRAALVLLALQMPA